MFTKIEVFLVETLLTILPCIFILLFFTICYYYVLVFIIIMYLEKKKMLFPGNFYPKVQYVKKKRQHLLPYNITKNHHYFYY